METKTPNHRMEDTMAIDWYALTSSCFFGCSLGATDNRGDSLGHLTARQNACGRQWLTQSLL